MIDLEELAAPFPVDAISWRVGSTTKDKKKGMALAYIDARDVMQRLDDVCGIGGWQNTYPHAGQRVICELSIELDGKWVTRTNGAGSTQIEADKGAISDAFKRAAVLWGIGRYLYSLGSVWVHLEPRGATHIIKKDQQYILDAALSKLGATPNRPQSNPVKNGASKGTPSRALYTNLVGEIEACGDDLDAMDILSKSEAFQTKVKQLPADWQGNLQDEYKRRKLDAQEKTI
ncbi:MAG: hypothetical protein COA43_01155 [Robiginitomaculum sp.]|nr:MAG: hypothetical protein COA43_01155 [Robiginitomaculum sp.]